MRFRFFSAQVILLAFCVCLAQDSSPTYHRDNQRTGRTGNLGPAAPRLRWSFRSQSSFEASPIISKDGMIYAASTDGRLYAFTSRGILRWTFSARDSIYATPAIGPDGTLFLADIAGWYHALSSDGTLRWSRRLTGGLPERRVTAPPVVAETGQSHVAAWNDRLYSFAPDGALLWVYSFEGEGQISAAPALDLAGNVYLATHDPSAKSNIAVYKIDPATSKVAWKFTDSLGIDRNRIVSSPSIDLSRGMLYVGTARDLDGCLHAVKTDDGTQAFRTVLPKGIVSSPAIAQDGTIVVGCLDGKVYALDAAGGRVRWELATGAYYVMGSPTIDGAGNIFVGDSDGVLHALTASGQELWRYSLQSNIVSAPSIAADGTIYVTASDSTLYAIGDFRTRKSTR